MLAMSDTPIDSFLPWFADTGVPVAFLVPTPTGYEKSIMDATAPVRKLFLDEEVHDYEQQAQGPQHKARIKSYFVHDDYLEETTASLYRPVTKQGDPRIWFDGLRKYCQPRNLLALIVVDGEIYVFNLSSPRVATSLMNHDFVYDVLASAVSERISPVAEELLQRLRIIHAQGFIPSITPGDPGVGDTLEDALGIRRNNDRHPDYRGIELKTTRLTRNGSRRTTTRSTLFTRVPDRGMTYNQILDAYGKWQIPRDSTEERFQLYETFRASRPNAYDLQLNLPGSRDELDIVHNIGNGLRYVASWEMENLRQCLLMKHPETFWIKAVSEMRDGREYFRYDLVLNTRHPNASLLGPLLENDKITVDLATHIEPDGRYRNHGVLFKMLPEDLPLLLGEAIEYAL